MGLNPINSVPLRGKLKTQRLMKRMPSEDGDRDLSDAKQILCFEATKQGMPRTVSTTKARKRHGSLERGHGPAKHTSFRLVGSRTAEK